MTSSRAGFRIPDCTTKIAVSKLNVLPPSCRAETAEFTPPELEVLALVTILSTLLFGEHVNKTKKRSVWQFAIEGDREAAKRTVMIQASRNT
jgi:hypothetical protein